MQIDGGAYMGCKHEFIGTVSGVHCRKCGLQLTAEEYGQLVKGSAKTTPKKTARKKVTTNE